MKILQINTSVNSGSTGRIAEDIGRMLIEKGHESYIAFGRNRRPSSSELIRIGTDWDVRRHVLKSRLLDLHGFGSAGATIRFITRIQEIKPDLIHLHNIHGYYINVAVLFDFLKSSQIPVVWTFHDCWPFTGHCSYFDYVQCAKWQQKCFSCANRSGYPKSWFIDNSTDNYLKKQRLFSQLPCVTLVTPSHWLDDHVGNSFLAGYPRKVIHNGVNLEIFKPSENSAVTSVKNRLKITGKKTILGVASTWNMRKGLNDFLQLRGLLPDDCTIILVGLAAKLIGDLPEGIIGISRTEDTAELAALYSTADVYVNPTWVDNFPTTNIEALACGTPVITYDTGGSPESIDAGTGRVVPKGDVDSLRAAIKEVIIHGKDSYRSLCRDRAVQLFNSRDRYCEYLHLYETLIQASPEHSK